MRNEGADVAYLGTEVLLDDETIVGTVCCFDGESSAQIEQLNERAGVPFEKTYRRGTPIAGERAKERLKRTVVSRRFTSAGRTPGRR